jgi:hypothetical protein
MPKERPTSLSKAFNWGRKRWAAFVTERAESGALTKHIVAASLASGNTTIKITPRSAAGDGDPAAGTVLVTAAARSATGGATSSGRFSAGVASGRFAGAGGGGASSRFAGTGGAASGKFEPASASGKENLDRCACRQSRCVCSAACAWTAAMMKQKKGQQHPLF